MSEPADPGEEGALSKGPFLVKVDRYGSVSGLVRVRVPLGVLTIVPEDPLVSGGLSYDEFVRREGGG